MIHHLNKIYSAYKKFSLYSHFVIDIDYIHLIWIPTFKINTSILLCSDMQYTDEYNDGFNHSDIYCYWFENNLELIHCKSNCGNKFVEQEQKNVAFYINKKVYCKLMESFIPQFKFEIIDATELCINSRINAISLYFKLLKQYS